MNNHQEPDWLVDADGRPLGHSDFKKPHVNGKEAGSSQHSMGGDAADESANSPFTEDDPVTEGFSLVGEDKPESKAGVYYDANVFVCGPLQILGVSRTRDDGDYGYFLRWLARSGKLHEEIIPITWAFRNHGSAAYEHLIENGLRVENTGLLVKYLQKHPVEAEIIRVEGTGWDDGRERYVFPDSAIYKGKDDAKVRLQPSCDASSAFACVGTLDGWRESVGKMCVGNSRLVLCCCAAFAGPLLHLTGHENFGLHWVGPTTLGKSTALRVGASIVGLNALCTWRTTDNGLERLAASRNDSTLLLDELAQFNSQKAAEVAYDLMNGESKSRMDKTLALRARVRWRVTVLSSGELTLAERAAQAGHRIKGGAEIRLLNIPADAGEGNGLFENLHLALSAREFAEDLKQSCSEHAGYPLRKFIRFITTNCDVQALIDHKERFVLRHAGDASGEVKRAAGHFGLLAAAGELATRANITTWSKGEADSAAERGLKDWLALRGGDGSVDVLMAADRVLAFISANGSSRFQHKQRPDDRIVNRAGFYQNGESGTEYLILADVFRTELCHGVNAADVAAELEQRKCLRRHGKHWTFRARLPGLGLTDCYCVLLSDEDPDDFEEFEL